MLSLCDILSPYVLLLFNATSLTAMVAENLFLFSFLLLLLFTDTPLKLNNLHTGEINTKTFGILIFLFNVVSCGLTTGRPFREVIDNQNFLFQEEGGERLSH